ncbi:MAG: cation:proton antiporter [Actinobacteria bacterium]|nr:cation:proton antiporter [Actinomycetota bacterium]
MAVLLVLALMLSTDDILTGLGLVIVLAVAARLVAQRLRVPALVILLPVGFIAGAITDDVHPEALLGAAFQPFVSLGVGLILFEAGLRLDVSELAGGLRKVVWQLVGVGAAVTFVGVTLAARFVVGLDWSIAAVLGAILVVSGPTVVLPLLAFIRPSDRIRSVLKWEGTLIDPLGALLGVIALHAVLQGAIGERPFHFGALLGSIAIGILVGGVAAIVLGLLLRQAMRSDPAQGIAVTLMMVTTAVVGADLLRDDSGLVAAAVMGAVLAGRRDLDVTRIVEFHGTVVELLIGVLFVLISASVSPSQVHAVLWDSLALVALMVLVIRPLAVALGTLGSTLDPGERAFAAWMAPRGIVAGATASSFALALGEAGIADAERLLPIVFVAIFATVVIYGLTGGLVARLLGVAGSGTPALLLLGGPPALALAEELQAAGTRVVLWSTRAEELAAAQELGIESAEPPFGPEAVRLESELEDVAEAFVLGPEDDYSILVAHELRAVLGHGHVHLVTAAQAKESALVLGPRPGAA